METPIYPLAICYMAIDNGPFSSLIALLKMVMFHRSVYQRLNIERSEETSPTTNRYDSFEVPFEQWTIQASINSLWTFNGEKQHVEKPCFFQISTASGWYLKTFVKPSLQILRLITCAYCQIVFPSIFPELVEQTLLMATLPTHPIDLPNLSNIACFLSASIGRNLVFKWTDSILWTYVNHHFWFPKRRCES